MTDKPIDVLYPDLDQELAITRKMLALVPEGNDEWRPHPKSYTLSALANHLAELPGFGLNIIQNDELDFAKQTWAPATFANNSERLNHFDKHAAELKRHVSDATWESLAKPWAMRAGEQVYVADTKSKLVRSFYISHTAHHRAQLGMYLRQLGIAIPGAYGPSADEM